MHVRDVLSQLQLFLRQADKIKEIANDVNFILEHKNILDKGSWFEKIK